MAVSFLRFEKNNFQSDFLKYLIICFKIGDLASASQSTCKNNDLSMIHIGSPRLALKVVVWRNLERLKTKKDKGVSAEASHRHIWFQSA